MQVLFVVFDLGFRITVSDVLAVAGILIAWQQYKSAKNAKQLVAETRRSMFKQRAAQHFNDISNKAGQLAGAVRGRNWDQATEVATALGGLVSSASGFADKIMLEGEKGSLTIAADSIKFILDQIPIGEHELDANVLRAMISQCTLIVYAVERVAGRMRYLGEIEDENAERIGMGAKSNPPDAPKAAIGDQK
jgi:hypothetical protein